MVCSLTMSLRCSMSISPDGVTRMAQTLIPAMCADAGFVPWALTGIKQILRPNSPRCS